MTSTEIFLINDSFISISKRTITIKYKYKYKCNYLCSNVSFINDLNSKFSPFLDGTVLEYCKLLVLFYNVFENIVKKSSEMAKVVKVVFVKVGRVHSRQLGN